MKYHSIVFLFILLSGQCLAGLKLADVKSIRVTMWMPASQYHDQLVREVFERKADEEPEQYRRKHYNNSYVLKKIIEESSIEEVKGISCDQKGPSKPVNKSEEWYLGNTNHMAWCDFSLPENVTFFEATEGYIHYKGEEAEGLSEKWNSYWTGYDVAEWKPIGVHPLRIEKSNDSLFVIDSYDDGDSQRNIKLSFQGSSAEELYALIASSNLVSTTNGDQGITVELGDHAGVQCTRNNEGNVTTCTINNRAFQVFF